MILKLNELYLLISIKTKNGLKSLCYELEWNKYFSNGWKTNCPYVLEFNKLKYRINSLFAREILKIPAKNSHVSHLIEIKYDKNFKKFLNKDNFFHFYNSFVTNSLGIQVILFSPIFSRADEKYPNFLISPLTFEFDSNFYPKNFICSYTNFYYLLNLCIFFKKECNYNIWYSNNIIDNTNLINNYIDISLLNEFNYLKKDISRFEQLELNI